MQANDIVLTDVLPLGVASGQIVNEFPAPDGVLGLWHKRLRRQPAGSGRRRVSTPARTRAQNRPVSNVATNVERPEMNDVAAVVQDEPGGFKWLTPLAGFVQRRGVKLNSLYSSVSRNRGVTPKIREI